MLKESLDFYKCPAHPLGDLKCSHCARTHKLAGMIQAEEEVMKHKIQAGDPIPSCYSYLVPSHTPQTYTSPEDSLVYLILQNAAF